MLAVTFTEAGTLQTGAGVTTGVTAQVRLTVPLNDPLGVIARLKDAICPAVTVAEFGDPDAGPMAKSAAAIPVPDSATFCGLPAALSATIKFATDPPTAVGINCTLMVQVANGSTLVQLLVWLNSPASTPPMVTLVTVSATAPVLVNVTGIGPLPVPTVCAGKVTAAGEKLTPGTETVVLISTKIVLPYYDQVLLAISVHVRGQCWEQLLVVEYGFKRTKRRRPRFRGRPP